VCSILELALAECHILEDTGNFWMIEETDDRLCGLAVRVPGYKSRHPGSIPGATRLSEK
jgi:hypothetical protein